MKNRTILGIVCIVLAVTVVFGVTPLVNRASSGRVRIVRMAKDVAQGAKIMDKDVETVAVGGYNLPARVIRNKGAVVGKYAACDIKADDLLLPSKLSDSAGDSDSVLRTLGAGEMAMSVPLDSFAAGLSGKLLGGDIVSVLVTGKDGAASIPSELRYVRVIAATASNGEDTGNGQAEDEKTASNPATVTLLVNEVQARLLAGYEATGKLQLILVYRGDARTAETYLKTQREVFGQ